MELRKLMGEIGSRAWGVGRVWLLVAGVLGVGASGARGVLVNIIEESIAPEGGSTTSEAPKYKGRGNSDLWPTQTRQCAWEVRLVEHLERFLWVVSAPSRPIVKPRERER